MSLSLRRVVAALVMSTAVLAATPAAARAATAEVDGDITVLCGTSTLTQDADWFFPDTIGPKALVFLQHGFSRSNSNVFALARKYQAAGFLVFAPTLPSTNRWSTRLATMPPTWPCSTSRCPASTASRRPGSSPNHCRSARC